MAAILSSVRRAVRAQARFERKRVVDARYLSRDESRRKKFCLATIGKSKPKTRARTGRAHRYFPSRSIGPKGGTNRATDAHFGALHAPILSYTKTLRLLHGETPRAPSGCGLTGTLPHEMRASVLPQRKPSFAVASGAARAGDADDVTDGPADPSAATEKTPPVASSARSEKPLLETLGFAALADPALAARRAPPPISSACTHKRCRMCGNVCNVRVTACTSCCLPLVDRARGFPRGCPAQAPRATPATPATTTRRRTRTSTPARPPSSPPRRRRAIRLGTNLRPATTVSVRGGFLDSARTPPDPPRVPRAATPRSFRIFASSA